MAIQSRHPFCESQPRPNMVNSAAAFLKTVLCSILFDSSRRFLEDPIGCSQLGDNNVWIESFPHTHTLTFYINTGRRLVRRTNSQTSGAGWVLYAITNQDDDGTTVSFMSIPNKNDNLCVFGYCREAVAYPGDAKQARKPGMIFVLAQSSVAKMVIHFNNCPENRYWLYFTQFLVAFDNAGGDGLHSFVRPCFEKYWQCFFQCYY